MHRPKLKIPRQPGRALGTKGVAEDQFDGTDSNEHVPSICLCSADHVCGWCHLQNRIAQAIHDSLKRQALGGLMREGI